MANNNNDQNKKPGTVPINVVPAGSGDQIDNVRRWEDAERTSTRSIMDRQSRKMSE